METGVYIHIPFCKSKCNYCDFVSFAQKNYEEYATRLIDEIKSCRQLQDATVKTIFIGGGTPSLFSCELIYKILDALNMNNADEITIEANPESITKEKIAAYRTYGINRISIGLQAMQNNLLKTLGRIHTFEMFDRAYEIAAEQFKNINIDIMFALPNQNLNDWEETLAYVKKLAPSHISAYSLIIEPGTKFHQMQNKLKLPDEETERKMYHMIKKILAGGYYQYEISNFARRDKKNFECRHNKIYWTLKNYLGFGLAAHSFFNGLRWNNTSDMKKYLSSENIVENVLPSTKKSLMEEFMFLGLRMTKGINKNLFKEKFGSSIKEIYGPQIKSLIEKKLLIEDENNICLSELGMDLANVAMSEFLLD